MTNTTFTHATTCECDVCKMRRRMEIVNREFDRGLLTNRDYFERMYDIALENYTK